MDIRYLSRNDAGELVENIVCINLASINSFGIFNRKAYRADRSFKKWLKCGWINYTEGSESKSISSCDPFYIKQIKEELKGKYTSEKYEVSEYKKTKYGYGYRTAIDWTYRIKIDSNKH